MLEETPLDHLARALPKATVTQLRAQGARFGLDMDRINTKVGSLSGGEKARLLLALATRDAPHILILDEPTNHLDIDAREALVKALEEYPGAVLLIAHDPHLVDLAAERLMVVANGRVEAYEDDLDAYRQLVTNPARAARAKPEAKAASKEERRNRAETRESLAPLRRAARSAEQRMAALNDERRKIEARLGDAKFYSRARPEEIAALNQRLGSIARDMAAAEEEWLVAEASLEAAE